MDPNQRIDYFRSELEGKLAELRKDMVGLNAAQTKRIAELEKSLETALRELHQARMAR